MDCNLKNREEIIAKYLMEELSESEMQIFEEHYFRCETCFNELKIAEDAKHLIEHEGTAAIYTEVSIGKKHKAGIKRFFEQPAYRYWGIGIASLAVIALVLIIVLQNKEQKIIDSNLSSAEVDSLRENKKLSLEKNGEKISGDEEVFAVLSGPGFEPDPYLEYWINENTRSGINKIDTILSPPDGKIFRNEPVLFKWEMNEETSIILNIMNNKEEKIFEAKPEIYLIKEIKADPEIFSRSGLFYWRLEDEKEVLFIGKFYFIKEESD